KFLGRQLARAEEKDRADRSLAQSPPQGITSSSNEKSSAARYHARDYSAHCGNEGHERDLRCNSDSALLDAAWRFYCDFDYSDLHLLFLNHMENSATINLDESIFDT